MKKIDSFFFPDNCYKPERVVERSSWIENAWPYVTDWSLAIDVGAYVGTVTRVLLGKFERVVAFEPLPNAFECLNKNVNVKAYNLACGSYDGECTYKLSEKSGYANLSPDGTETAKIIKLDNFHLNPGLIKIDAEFTDEEVIDGASETILRSRPVIMVEVKGKLDRMDKLMAQFDYSPVVESKRDKIYTWNFRNNTG